MKVWREGIITYHSRVVYTDPQAHVHILCIPLNCEILRSLSQIDDREMAKLRQNVVDLFSSYKIPEGKEEKEEDKKNKEEEDEVILPIPEGALTTNLGIPVVVVLSKVGFVFSI